MERMTTCFRIADFPNQGRSEAEDSAASVRRLPSQPLAHPVTAPVGLPPLPVYERMSGQLVLDALFAFAGVPVDSAERHLGQFPSFPIDPTDCCCHGFARPFPAFVSKNFRHTGGSLYCCNQRADNIAVFQVNRKTGGLTFTGHYTPVGNPSSIVFLDLGYVGLKSRESKVGELTQMPIRWGHAMRTVAIHLLFSLDVVAMPDSQQPSTRQRILQWREQPGVLSSLSSPCCWHR